MDQNELLALYDRHQRIEIEHPGIRKDVFPGLVRFVRPKPEWSFISYSSLEPAEAEAQIEAQFAYFQENGLSFSWTVFEHDSPVDLKERLAARGCKIHEEVDVMVLDLRSVPASLLVPPETFFEPALPAEIRAITLPEQLEEVVHVLGQVWGGDFNWVYERIGNHLGIPGFLNVYAAYVQGQPASVGWIYFHPDNPFANLNGGSTVLGQRGRGLYTALLAVRTQDALRRGYRFLTIDASPMSGRIAQRYGFLHLVRACDCDKEFAPGS